MLKKGLKKPRKNRSTSHRFWLLSQIQSMHSHPRADELFLLVARKLPSMSMGTLYRNLDWLEKHGHISALRYTAEYARYEARTDIHYHFICDICDRVVEIELEPLIELNQQISKRHSLEVDRHKLYFFGICPACRAAALSQT